MIRKHNMATNAIKSLPALYRPYLEELLLNDRSYSEIFEIMSKKKKVLMNKQLRIEFLMAANYYKTIIAV